MHCKSVNRIVSGVIAYILNEWMNKTIAGETIEKENGKTQRKLQKWTEQNSLLLSCINLFSTCFDLWC